VPTEKRARQKAARHARLEAERRRDRRRRLLRRGAIVAGIAVVVGVSAYFITKGSSSPSNASAAKSPQAQANAVAVAAGCPASPSTQVNSLTWNSAPPMTIDTSKNYTATVKTTVGTFTIALDAKAAPQTVNNFVFLADKGYFHCVIFHRVIPSFMDQTGDPTGTGTGGNGKQPGYTIPDENLPTSAPAGHAYALGAVAMANTGQPHTGGSQFFIVAGPEGQGLQPQYSLFGQVASGMNVVDKINAQGSKAGVPPDVTQRMLTVSISSS